MEVMKLHPIAFKETFEHKISLSNERRLHARGQYLKYAVVKINSITLEFPVTLWFNIDEGL